MEKTDNGTVNFNGIFDGAQISLNVSGGIINFNGQSSLNALNASNAKLNFYGQTLIDGALIVQNNSAINFNSYSSLKGLEADNAKLNFYGQTLIDGAVIVQNNSAINFSSTTILQKLTLNTGTINFSSQSFLKDLEINNSNLNFYGQALIKGAVIVQNNSTINFSSTTISQKLTLNTGSINFSSQSFLKDLEINNSNLNFHGQALINGAVIVQNNSTINFSSTTILQKLTLNTGTINFSSQSFLADIEMSAGEINFYQTAFLNDINAGAGIVNFYQRSVLNNAVIDNGAVINFSSSIIKDLNVLNGAVNFKSNISTAASIDIGADGSLSLQNGVAASTLYVTGDFNLAGALAVDVNFEKAIADLIWIDGIFTAESGSNLSVARFGAPSNIGLEFLRAQTITEEAKNLKVDIGYRITYEGHSLYLSLDGTWNVFAAQFKNFTGVGEMALSENLNAADEFKTAVLPLGSTSAEQLLIVGNNNALNSAWENDLGFVLNKSSITFSNIILKNFVTADAKSGAAINTQNSSLTFVGNITFTSNAASAAGGAIFAEMSLITFINAVVNFSSNTAIDSLNNIYLNDIYLDENSSIIFSGANTFINGLKTNGAQNAMLLKTDEGLITFEKESSLLNTFTITQGSAAFKSNVSSVSKLNVLENATLLMQNGNAVDNINIIEDFVLGGIWTIDVNFNTLTSDKISVGSNAEFLKGSILSINQIGQGSGQKKSIEILTAGGEIKTEQNLIVGEKYSVTALNNSLFLTPNGDWNIFAAQFRNAKDYDIVTPYAYSVLNASVEVLPIPFWQTQGNFLTIDGANKTLNAANNIIGYLGFVFGGNDFSSSATFKNISFTKFSQNNNSDAGIVFNVQNSTIIFTGAINFTQNNGATIISANDNAQMRFIGAKAAFSQNIAQEVFYLENSLLSFENSNLNFTNNISGLNGAAVFANNKSSIVFTNSTAAFTNNKAQDFGGAVFINDSEIYFYNSNITFKNNTAQTILNDIALEANAVMHLLGNNNFANGIRTAGGQNGAGSIFVNGNSVFAGEVNIQNSFTIAEGNVILKNSSSTIKNLNILEQGSITLVNSNPNDRLYIETLNLGGAIEMDVNANAADRLIVLEDINLTDTNKFSLNILTNQNFITILAQGQAITGTAVSADEERYFIFQTENSIFARFRNSESSQNPDQARVSAWNDFVNFYQNAMWVENDEIILQNNLLARSVGDAPLSQTQAKAAFIINGNGFGLNAQKLENAFFDLQNKVVTFKNISLANFKNTNQLMGAAINADNNSTIHLSGNINFSNNFSQDKPNDITLQDADSVIVFDNGALLANGLRTQGLGTLEKRDQGEVSFQGAPSIIENDFNVLAGRLNFKSAISSVNYLNMNYGSSLSLQDDKAGSKLYAGVILMRSNLALDIDFKSAIADQIFASSVTIFSGYKLTIKDANPLDLTENEIPIIIASSSQTFTILGSKAFDYDEKLYSLRYDNGKLFIKNIKPPDIEEDNENSPNREAVEEIVNGDGRLKIPLSKLSMDKRRKALDSLSGVFTINIFAAQTQLNSEFLFNQIQQEASIGKVWADANYSVLEFSKHEQTLGKFRMINTGADIGVDFLGARFGSMITRLGVYANANTKEFTQDQSKASVNDLALGIYENTNIANFNLQFLAGLRYANVNTSRIIEMEENYNPVAEFNIVSIETALNASYDFDMRVAKAGPFILLEASQNKFSEIAEHGGLITDLTFEQASWTKAQGLLGAQIKSKYNFIDVFARGYAGIMLAKDPTFQVRFTSIENSIMQVESDRVNELFYGLSGGLNVNIGNDIRVGVMGYGRLSHSFANYGGQFNITYALRGDTPKLPELESPIEAQELSLKDKQAVKYFVKKLMHSNREYKAVTIKLYLNVSQDEETKRLDNLKLTWAQNVYREMLKNGLPANKIKIIRYRIKPITTNIELHLEM
ncbi:MAG: hypothetical protein LBC07_00695 [Elusimicrobiota bacterium]|jgi:hypothetical protein|nr:hypothetical protein [Elusimicrobiota bacterium]